jgi:hypothetical protein
MNMLMVTVILMELHLMVMNITAMCILMEFSLPVMDILNQKMLMVMLTELLKTCKMELKKKKLQ